MEWILEIVGFVLIWAATDVGRDGCCKIRFMSLKWWAVFLLLVAGVFLIKNEVTIPCIQ